MLNPAVQGDSPASIKYQFGDYGTTLTCEIRQEAKVDLIKLMHCVRKQALACKEVLQTSVQLE